ncbi:DNA-binding protein [Dermabacteraceae bacterium TAE3-ERU27]|nr:DNA-binding protein [Dermabacteraceae bacterium TAE3-ERU27]
MEKVETLVTDWLNLPDVATHLDIEVGKVRRLVEGGELIALKRGKPPVRSVPALFLLDGEIIPHLAGTITVLRDARYSDEEILIWLFTEDDSLPGRPVDQLRKGQRGEVRRRAQALAF